MDDVMFFHNVPCGGIMIALHRRRCNVVRGLTLLLLGIGRLRNDLYCVEWGVKLYSNQLGIGFILS